MLRARDCQPSLISEETGKDGVTCPRSSSGKSVSALNWKGLADFHGAIFLLRTSQLSPLYHETMLPILVTLCVQTVLKPFNVQLTVLYGAHSLGFPDAY